MAIAQTVYKTSSPYYTTQYLDSKFLDILSYRTLTPQADDIYKQIGATYQYRPDLMSFDLYKTADYWWVFAIRNKDTIIDPVWDFKAEKFIYIPKLTTIINQLGL